MEVEAAPLLLLLLACFCAIATSQRVDLYDGDICKREGGAEWTCTALKNCSSAKRLTRQGKRPLLCNFNGRDPIVCCQPEGAGTSTSIKVGAKSLQKCQEYAKSVFTVLNDANRTKINHCANVEPLITNGQRAQPREYPHMALIGYGPKAKIEWLCGGSLISERFVLSAAHCTDSKGKGLANWVRLGEYNVMSDLDENSGLAQPDDYQIIARINHKGYDPNQPYDDIALYRLDKVVKFNEFIRPACLHTTRTFAKTYAIATGWGRTENGVEELSDYLLKGNFTIIESQRCRDDWKGLISFNYNSSEGIRDESQMCAGDVRSGVDTCQGDSGGPLQLRLSDPFCMYSVIGVTSFGQRCGGNYPGVYTRVSHYIQWIESVVWP